MLRETSAAAMEKALQGVALRQQAIANNIANAETPNHRPQQVSFEGALLAAIERESDSGASGQRATAVERVVVETEMTGLAKASLQYEALARTLGKHFRMLRSAITGGSSS